MNNQDFDIEIVEIDEESAEDFPLLVEESEPEEDVVEDELDEDSPEYQDWASGEDFVDYIVASARKAPATFADSKNSLRRAFAYLEGLSEELVEGVEKDAAYSELSEEQLRTLDTIEQGIERALSDISAAHQGQLTKIATKSSKFTYYVNPFIFSLARILVNGKVSQGHNIELLYGNLNTKYKLSDREQLELHFVLEDMGHPIVGSPVGGVDRAEQYHA